MVLTFPSVSQATGSLSLLLALAGDDLNLLCFDVVGVIQLELDILDDESPDFVAEAVRVEVSLRDMSAPRHIPSIELDVFIP